MQFLGTLTSFSFLSYRQWCLVRFVAGGGLSPPGFILDLSCHLVWLQTLYILVLLSSRSLYKCLYKCNYFRNGRKMAKAKDMKKLWSHGTTIFPICLWTDFQQAHKNSHIQIRVVLQTVISGKLMMVTHCEKHFRTEPTQTSGHVNSENVLYSTVLLLSSRKTMKIYLYNKN